MPSTSRSPRRTGRELGRGPGTSVHSQSQDERVKVPGQGPSVPFSTSSPSPRPAPRPPPPFSSTKISLSFFVDLPIVLTGLSLIAWVPGLDISLPPILLWLKEGSQNGIGENVARVRVSRSAGHHGTFRVLRLRLQAVLVSASHSHLVSLLKWLGVGKPPCSRPPCAGGQRWRAFEARGSLGIDLEPPAVHMAERV